MRKLALSDEILLTVDKPARYIGNEVNSVMKNNEEVKHEHKNEKFDQLKFGDNYDVE